MGSNQGIMPFGIAPAFTSLLPINLACKTQLNTPVVPSTGSNSRAHLIPDANLGEKHAILTEKNAILAANSAIFVSTNINKCYILSESWGIMHIHAILGA